MNTGWNVITSVNLSIAKPIEESFVTPSKVEKLKALFTSEPRAVTM